MAKKNDSNTQANLLDLAGLNGLELENKCAEFLGGNEKSRFVNDIKLSAIRQTSSGFSSYRSAPLGVQLSYDDPATRCQGGFRRVNVKDGKLNLDKVREKFDELRAEYQGKKDRYDKLQQARKNTEAAKNFALTNLANRLKLPETCQKSGWLAIEMDGQKLSIVQRSADLYEIQIPGLTANGVEILYECLAQFLTAKADVTRYSSALQNSDTLQPAQGADSSPLE